MDNYQFENFVYETIMIIMFLYIIFSIGSGTFDFRTWDRFTGAVYIFASVGSSVFRPALVYLTPDKKEEM